MKRSAKSLHPQINLPLLNVPTTVAADTLQNELTIALMELLIGAAETESEQPGNGGEDESETNA